MESLAVDQAGLMRAAVPDLPSEDIAALEALARAGITQRMAAASGILLTRLGEEGIGRLAAHPSDTVRGWAAYMAGRLPGIDLPDRLGRLRGFADDPHFGVREWAWMAVRPHLAADIGYAIRLLVSWTAEGSANLRRFAVEATRPRGVWCSHIPALKADPGLGLPLLEPLRSDPAPYVQDSVANWLNDAAKDQPAWVKDLCARWSQGSPPPSTLRICGRATRSL